MPRRAAAAGSLLAAPCLGTTLPARQPAQEGAAAPRLEPTAHPGVPSSLEAMWYVPPAGTTAPAAAVPLARGVRLLEDDADARRALPCSEAARLTGHSVIGAGPGPALNQLRA